MSFSRPLLPLFRLGAAALAGALFLPAAPAAAGGGITSPGPDEVVVAEGVVALRAVVDGPTTSRSELSLIAPDDSEGRVVAVQASPGGGELAHDFDTSCAQAVCAGRVPAANGTWTLRLTGATTDERRFLLRIPPAAPVDVSAAGSTDGVELRWPLGAEPDLTGYAVQDGSGAVVQEAVGLDACAGGECRTQVPATAQEWTVVAYRSTCPGCRQVLASPPSAAVRVEQTAPDPLPAAEQEPSPAAAQGPDQSTAFAGAYGAGRPQAAPALPPRAAVAPAPAPDGSYDVELGYGAGQPAAQPGSGDAATSMRVADPLAELSANRVPLMVLGSVLVAGSVWLRRWARRTITDGPPGT